MRLSRSSWRAVVLLALFLLPTTTASAQTLLHILTSGGECLGCVPGDAPEVLVVNTTTGHTVARIPMGGPGERFYGDMVVLAASQRAYVTNETEVLVVDLAAYAIVSSITVGAHPRKLALSGNGSRLFVANAGSDDISVVDTATNTVVETIALGVAPTGEMALAPDESRLYVMGDQSARLIHVLDLATRTIVGGIPTGAFPTHMVVHPDGSTIYVTWDDTLAAIDTDSFAVLGTLDLDLTGAPYEVDFFSNYHDGAGPLAILPDGSRLYVPLWLIFARTSPTAFNRWDYVRVVDPRTLVVETTIGGAGTAATTVHRDGSHVFATGYAGTGIIDGASNAYTRVGPSVANATAIGSADAPSCWFEIEPLTRYVRTQTSLTIDVPAPPGCTWSASASEPWLFFTAPSSGEGPGTITLGVAPGAPPRTATIDLAGRQIVVTQLAAHLVLETPSAHATVTQPFTVSGWTVDDDGAGGEGMAPGMAALVVWAYPDPGSGRPPVLVGELPALNQARPDVEAMFGPLYRMSGFSVRVRGLPAGTYQLVVYALSRYDGTFQHATLTVTVRRQPGIVIDSLHDGEAVLQPFHVGGWAMDGSAPGGTGVDAVAVWAHPQVGSPVFLGFAALGLTRGDVSALYGPDFQTVGYALAGDGLAPGWYVIAAYAHCTLTGTWDAVHAVTIYVAGSSQPMELVGDWNTQTLFVGGYALDRRATSGTGVDMVQVWAHPAAGGAPIYLGQPEYGHAHWDAAAMFGTRFLASGWFAFLPPTTLPPGTYLIAAYARSTVTGRFDLMRVLVLTGPH